MSTHSPEMGARKVLRIPHQRLCEDSGNTTHGSGWIVQVRPTEGGPLSYVLEYHPRQWVDRSSPAYKESGSPLCLVSLSPRGARGERENRESRAVLYRLALNHPPTAVGGIPVVSHSLVTGTVVTRPE